MRLTAILLLGLVGLGFASPPAAGDDGERSWRERVAAFQKDFRSHDPKERQMAIWDHLEKLERREVVRLLVRRVLAEDEAGSVQEAAVTVLSELESREAVETLIEESKRGDERLRARVLEAIAHSRSPLVAPRLREAAAATKSPRIRMMGLVGLGRQRDVKSVDLLAEALEDDAWPIRAAAAEALGRVGRKILCAPPLIRRLGRDTGRVREDLRDALVAISEKNYGVSFGNWKRWYEEGGLDLEYERGSLLDRGDAPTVVYHGVRTWADRVVFVFDISKSMGEKARVDRQRSIPAEIREAGGEELERWKSFESKIDWARGHLIHSILTMADGVHFGVVIYHHGIMRAASELAPASEKTRASAISTIESLSPSGDTDLYRALRRAFHIPKRDDFGPNFVEGPQTIYFMTDGFATEGEITEAHPIAQAIERINVFRRVKIHCVGIGEHDSSLLSRLASRSNGAYVTLD